LIQKDTYQDSVVLMQLSKQLLTMEGVKQAMALMGTPQNKAVLRDAGLLTREVDAARPNDLAILVMGEDERLLDAALGFARQALSRHHLAEGTALAGPAPRIRTIRDAMVRLPGANIALISTPGSYAAAEAFKALKSGLHVMLFSSNVSLEDELALKVFARGRGLIVMGPDCGTAILAGVPLGLANVVPQGSVGIVAASGSGLQELTCQLARQSIGISHAIGTGSRDLRKEIGGITMSQGYEALLRDEATRLIVLLSKPPSPEIADQVLARCKSAPKPVVICFLGWDAKQVSPSSTLSVVRTIEQAALAVADMLNQRIPTLKGAMDPELLAAAHREQGLLLASQRFIRGLFSGGTLCSEALVVLAELGHVAYSNVPLTSAQSLSELGASQADVLLDLGTDEYTLGKPHPIIDYRTRISHLLDAAGDPSVGVVLLDVVLGRGAHPDPASELLPAIRASQQRAAEAGRHLAVVATVCGTQYDLQNLERQERALQEAGVLLAPNTAHATRLAHAIIRQG
jgi:succinyl-CoA synthetase alpha subunit